MESTDALASLRRRRDELASQVAELHWDLGGLTYEMAIRDHFRLDVLLQRAAQLQERDAELAELERLLRLEEGASAGECPKCGAPHSRGALFCWQCGTQLMARPENGAPPEPVAAPEKSLPGPGAAAVLVLAMLGFGVLTGSVARGSSSDVPARRGALTLVLPAASAGTGPVASVPALPAATATVPPSLPPSTPTPTEAAGESAAESPSSSATGGKPAGGGGASKGTSTTPRSTRPAATTLVPAPASKSALPPIKHVFLIVLADQPYASTFGPASAAPYLAGTLEKQGELLVRYYAVARDELANEIALVSGLGPTPETATNCPTFLPLSPATKSSDGQYAGSGCVYPGAVPNVGAQLVAKKLTWRAYAEDMERGGAGQPSACRHPGLGAPDPSAQARAGDAFATYRNPFSYFDSVIHSTACAQADVGLATLKADLAVARRTPALAYIVPNLCHDGRETPCTPGEPAGLPAADSFLRRVVPEILASPAYKQGGLLVITTDQAPATGTKADSSSCCSQPRFPGIPGNQPTGAQAANPALPPPGGGQVGALLLSRYVKAHTFDQEPFNHFSLLRTIEDLFGLAHLGYAGSKGVESLNPTVFSGYSGG
ncbi:MAG TPA: alkaline phosphatase family protein [Solirubrobacteraceae bacterium]|jgi:hypothetical protein